MAEGQRILVREEKRKGPALLPPSDVRSLAPLFIGAGVILSIAGWTDMALFFFPPQFSSREWEFGVIARSLDAMPLPTMGLVFLLLGARARGGAVWFMRIIAIVFSIVSLLCVAGLVLFALDIPLAVEATQRAQATPGGAAVAAGLQRAIPKALLFAIAYAVFYAWMAVKTWRSVRVSTRP